MSPIVEGILQFLAVVPAIVFHEVSHGFVALQLGDPTAKSRGRLSLNPLKHVDPFGTIILPVVLRLAGLPMFGYAKPVPINPMYFKDRRRGMFITAMAGPASNIVMAIAGGILLRIVVALAGLTPQNFVVEALFVFAFYFTLWNLVLLFFNIIPIPPLDGSRILPLFLNDRQMRTYAQWERYGFFILLGVLWLPDILGFNPLGWYLDHTIYPVFTFLSGVGL